MTPRARRPLRFGVAVTLAVTLLAGLALLPVGCHGHVVRAVHAPNHDRDFDFARPECSPAERPDLAPGDLLVRYLGVGGLWLERGGEAVLTAPFFSRYGLSRVLFGRLAWDDEVIDRGLDGLPLDFTRGVLVGHSHYDHLGDLPPILRRHVRTAPVFVNASGARMLEACQGVGDRLVNLDGRSGEPFLLDGPDGTSGRIRITALESSHAPHARGVHFGKGEVQGTWDCIRDRKIRKIKQGKTYAFLIDFLAEDGQTIDFRVHYQDAASSAPDGFPSPALLGGRDVDLAIVCMPSSWLVDGYPEKLLQHVRARHALVTHYEDFFRPNDKTPRFVATLTDRRADRFLARANQAMVDPARLLVSPDPAPCGPSSEAVTMPIAGEWLRFRVHP